MSGIDCRLSSRCRGRPYNRTEDVASQLIFLFIGRADKSVGIVSQGLTVVYPLAAAGVLTTEQKMLLRNLSFFL